MTDMQKVVPAHTLRVALVPHDRINIDEDFCFRAGGLNDAHKADLASTIRHSGRALDPILLWQSKSDMLILLDGLHRLMAYHAAGWSQEIPAMILVEADRRTALGAALKANSKRALGLSQTERMDAAWRLVREPVTPRFKVREIVLLADVAGRTVDNMRSRFRTMHEEDIEITGSWARDQRSLPLDDDELGRMTDEQRRGEIEKLAAEIRDLVDRRKHPERAILRESEAVWEALQTALGERNFKDMLAYLLGGDGDEADEWLAMAEACRNDVAEDRDADEPEPKF